MTSRHAFSEVQHLHARDLHFCLALRGPADSAVRREQLEEHGRGSPRRTRRSEGVATSSKVTCPSGNALCLAREAAVQQLALRVERTKLVLTAVQREVTHAHAAAKVLIGANEAKEATLREKTESLDASRVVTYQVAEATAETQAAIGQLELNAERIASEVAALRTELTRAQAEIDADAAAVALRGNAQVIFAPKGQRQRRRQQHDAGLDDARAAVAHLPEHIVARPVRNMAMRYRHLHRPD